MTNQNIKTETLDSPEKNVFYLVEGNMFTPIKVKFIQSKAYSNQIAKLLIEEPLNNSIIVFSSSAKIVKILSQPWAMNVEFEVVKDGSYNNHPILTLRTENKEVQKQIIELFF